MNVVPSHGGWSRVFCALLGPVVLVSFSFAASAQTASQAATPTVVSVSSSVNLSSAKRLGINLGAQTYFDSGMLQKNLVSRNPGFEGETWQSVLHCQAASSTSCTDDNPYSSWPADFFAGAQMEVVTGNATGQTATVSKNNAANRNNQGVKVFFSGLSTSILAGDYVVVRMSVPGNAQAGWWTSGWGSPTFSTEFNDLSSETLGKQAFRMSAPSVAQGASLNSYFDSNSTHSFVRLKGVYTISFRAKGLGGTNLVNLSLSRITDSGANTNFLSQNVILSNTWKDYSFSFAAQETGVKGILSLSFFVSGATVLLDDVSVAPLELGTNKTAFRDEVVSTLKTLNPGILRYMDSGTNWGSSFDNMIAPAFARTRGGYSNYGTEADDIPIGLHDFLVLCQTLNVEPWYTMQTGMPIQDMKNLMEYLGGSPGTTYGAKRAALGQTTPWTSVFPKIHLEFGNEVWNTANPGASMTDPAKYAERTTAIFAAAKASPSYSGAHIDLIADGWAAVPSWNQQVLAAGSNIDTIDAAPYLFYTLNDASSNEAIFGPMFAQVELRDSVAGAQMQQQAAVAASASPPVRLSVYETNLSTLSGNVPQSSVTAAIASLGAGMTSVEHMLMMMRDDGITDQTMFSIAGYAQTFSTSGMSEQVPLWGGVIDMGGDTNLRRPSYVAQQLANTAILPTMLATSQSGANPTWNQTLSSNDSIQLAGAHYVQSFAFTDGTTNKLIVFNLGRTRALPVSFIGKNAPVGSVTIQTLTSANITDNNETSATVGVTSTTATLTAGQSLTLPPFSMVVITSQVAGPPTVTGITANCSASVAVSGTGTCTASVSGTGSYSSGVTWNASSGSISASGVYTAPAVRPSSGQVTITATSVQDTTKSDTTTIAIASSSTVTSVTVNCANTGIGTGSSTDCDQVVTGTGSFSSNVTWSASVGTITSTGLYTAPTAAPASGTAIVTAVSTQDATKKSSVTLSIRNLSAIQSVTPTCTPASVNPSTQVVCTATVNGTGTFSSDVVWTSSVGTIFTTGVFNVPANASGTITIKAVSSADTTKSGTTTLVITPMPTITSISASCTPSATAPATQIYCVAALTGTGAYASSVTWKASTGAVFTTGVYNVPAGASGLVTITATSNQDPTKSASVNVNITPSH